MVEAADKHGLDAGHAGPALAATHPAVETAHTAAGTLNHDRGFASGVDTIIAGVAATARGDGP